MSKNLPSNWSSIKRQWKKINPPDIQGYYICWICNIKVHISKLTLDHVLPLETYPEYGADLTNLRPAHEFCNQHRGGNNLLKRYGKAKKRMW